MYELIFTSYLTFAYNISLTESLGQATLSCWAIDAFCPTLSSLLYFSAFQLHWPAITPFQPVLMTSVSAEPIWAPLRSCSAGHSTFLMELFHCISDSSSAGQSASLSVRVSKLPFQISQSSVSVMLSGELSLSFSTGWRLILWIQRIFKISDDPPGS